MAVGLGKAIEKPKAGTPPSQAAPALATAGGGSISGVALSVPDLLTGGLLDVFGGNAAASSVPPGAAGGGGGNGGGGGGGGGGKPLTSLPDVTAYISKNGTLPPNFIDKAKAKALGWSPAKGNLGTVAPGMSIGGDEFKNLGSPSPLPVAPGRQWFEADIDYTSGPRGASRILYSNDGLIYSSTDHYKTFTRIK